MRDADRVKTRIQALHVGKKDAANAGAELSAQFQDKVVNSLKDTSTQTVTTIKWTELSRSTGSWTNL
jgi:hypothetical protein